MVLPLQLSLPLSLMCRPAVSRKEHAPASIIKRFVLIDTLFNHLLHACSITRLVAPSCLEKQCFSEFLFCPMPSFLIPVPKIAVLFDSAKDIALHHDPLEICGKRLDGQRIFG